MKRKLTTLFSIIGAVLLAMTSASYAGNNGGFVGKIAGVDTAAGTVTVSKKKTGESKTFKVSPTTEIIKEDGSKGQISDLHARSRAQVTVGTEADQATKIEIKNKKKKGETAEE